MTAGRNAETLNLLDDLAKEAQKRRVTGFVFNHTGGDAHSVTVRNGEVEHVGGENPNGVSIEVYLGNRIGFASTNSLNPADLKATLSEAILRARISSADKSKAITDPEDITSNFPDLDLYDPYVPSTEDLIKTATAVEAAALANPKITNSAGGLANYAKSTFTMVASNGFRGDAIVVLINNNSNGDSSSRRTSRFGQGEHSGSVVVEEEVTDVEVTLCFARNNKTCIYRVFVGIKKLCKTAFCSRKGRHT